MKGLTLETGTLVTLALDGTLVYVEDVQPTYAAVVALPEQPPERSDDRVFTPGRVGAKKISPFSRADRTVPSAELSPRNLTFIANYEALRTAHGPNHVDRTPAEQTAFDAKNASPPQRANKRVKLTNEEKAAIKAAKKTAKGAGPRYLQRCARCNEQPGHPNHPDQHEFVTPSLPVVVLCAACDEPEAADVHTKDKINGGHKFVAGTAIKQPRIPREPKQRKPRADKVKVRGKHRWVNDAAKLTLLRAANGKYNEDNSGNALIELIKAAGEAGLAPEDVVGQPKCPSTYERAELAFTQLLGVGLLEPVVT